MSAHYDDEDLQENVVEAMADFAKRLSDAQRERVALLQSAPVVSQMRARIGATNFWAVEKLPTELVLRRPFGWTAPAR